MQPPIFRWYPARQVTGHLGYIEGKQTRKQLAARYGVSVRTIERDLEGDALRPESVKGQACRNPDGYNLLGQGLRADGDKGHLQEQDPMAQVCQIRDDSGLPGGRELAQGAWLHDIRCGHRRPARLGGSIEDISGPALPVPPDDDCKALSDRQSRHWGLA